MRTIQLVAAGCLGIGAFTSLLYRQLEPEWVDFRRAERQFHAARYPQAAARYRAAVDHGMRDARVFRRLAEAQLKTKDSSGAGETARAFLRTGTSSPEETYAMSELFIAHGEFTTAGAVLESLLQKTPAHRQARFRLAQLLTWTQRFDEAVQQYQILLGDSL